MSGKKIGLFVGLIVLVVLGAYAIVALRDRPESIPQVEQTTKFPIEETIGRSVEGRTIKSYTYGDGSTHLLFVGGVHGGYEWNSVLLAYEFMDYFDENPSAIPSDVKVTIIPSANPDAVFDVVGKEGRFVAADASEDEEVLADGRFNSNGVDLNRNFDCKWQPESMWRSRKVSAGTKAFSEPEAQAIRDFALKYTPDAVVFWHSQANAVYASECEDGILPVTLDVMNTYAKAAGYNAIKTFDSYAVTGDAEGWLASINIPAVTVELKTHGTIEWEKNLAGVKALLNYFSEK